MNDFVYFIGTERKEGSCNLNKVRLLQFRKDGREYDHHEGVGNRGG